MENIPLFAGLYVCHVVQDFFHQQYHNHTRMYNGYTALVRHVAPKLALSFPRNHLHSQHFEGKIYTFTLCNLIMETGCCCTVVTVSLSKKMHITSHNTQKGYKIATDRIIHQQMSCPFQTQFEMLYSLTMLQLSPNDFSSLLMLFLCCCLFIKTIEQGH